MRLRIEPNFVHRTAQPRFYVRTLDQRDEGWSCGYRWQIQMLNEDGQGAATIEFGPSDGEDFLQFLALDVSPDVKNAAKSGICDYVDDLGRQRLPLFLGGDLLDSEAAMALRGT